MNDKVLTSTLSSHLIIEWHPTKNSDLLPTHVTKGSHKKVWWLGQECGHEWEAQINSRSNGANCPYCAGRKILTGFNDLSTVYPKIAEEWHPLKNHSLLSSQISSSSHEKVWWLGKNCQHTWQASVNNRSKGSGCPVCAGKQVLTGFNDLKTLEPLIAKGWHLTKNTLTPDQVNCGSNIKAWWICEKGHEWETRVADRINGSGCPICIGRQVLIGYNDLATVAPLLAFELHPTKNKNESAYTLTAMSAKKVWWLGKECGHEWQTVVSDRSRGTGCPICAGQITLSGFNDLATKMPHLINEWHPTKNDDLLPNHVTSGSDKNVWWQCALGHEWQTQVNNRSKGGGCPTCAGKKALSGFNDLASRNLTLTLEWHPTKNDGVLPSQVTSGSDKNVWWECALGHEWQAAIVDRSNGNGCPICAGKKVLVGFNDLQTKLPALTLEWHPIKNGDLTPIQFTTGSSKKVWWQCDKQHEWQATVASRSQGNGCPVCAGRRVLIGFNDLATTHLQLTKEWHPTKNGELLPAQVIAGSHIKVWWQCNLGHEWNIAVASRSQGNGCPICAGKRILIGFNDLQSKLPALTLEWHPIKNGDLTPIQFTTGSSKKVWWQCNLGHEWNIAVASRSQGNGCPICAGKRVLIGFNDLQSQRPVLTHEWHPLKNENLLPNQVTVGSARRVWWQCNLGHEWRATISDRTRLDFTSCPNCSKRISKPEQNIVDFLVKQDLTIQQSNRSLIGKELDIYIPSYKLAIEYNGLYWHTEDKGKDKTYHYNKWFACKEKGVQLIQIWEDEWLKNPEQIKAMLLHKLGITQQEKVFARKTHVIELKKPQIELFLQQHHVQGYAAGSHYLGLREKVTNELVSVLVLKKEANNTLNIIRYATSKNVVGGFTKLLKYAELTYKPERFITFSDHCVSDGGLYKNNGFTSDKELLPDYRYVVGGERLHKFGYRLKRFRNDPNLKYGEGLTERELAALNGLPRIWDAGKTRWMKSL